jgi:tetratricopeptide (TPR) repeat protein
MKRNNCSRWDPILVVDRHGAPRSVTRLLFVILFLLPLNCGFGQSDFDSHLAEAVRAQSAGDVSAAILAYQSALTLRRDVPEVWANLGLMQHQAGDRAGALQSFKVAHQLQPKLFVPVLFLGIENLQLGNRTEAIRYLTIARQLRPNDRETYLNLGSAYFGLKQFENASISYRRATELNPNDGEGWYRLGITYLEMSEAAAGDFARLNPGSPFFQRLNAESLSDQEKLAQAMEVFYKLLSGPTSPPCSRSSLGMVLIRVGKPVEATTEFEQDTNSGGCSLAKLGMIRLELANGEGEVALRSLGSLWSTDSGFVKAYAFELTRGMAAEQSKAFDELLLAKSGADGLPQDAVSVLRTSLRGGRTLSFQSDLPEDQPLAKAELESSQSFYQRGEYAKCSKNLLRLTDPASHELSLLATCAFYTGDFKTALSAAKKLRTSPRTIEEGFYQSILAEQRMALLALGYAGEVEPNSIRLHELLAESYRDRERYVEAEAEYKVALNLNPKEFAALVGAATNYLQEMRIDPAREMIQEALTQKPTDPEANYIMGEVLIAEHKFTEAEPFLRAGLTARAELVPRIHALLGQVYADQGETKLAIDEYKAGLPSDDDGSVHFQLGRLYQKVGEKDLAAKAFADSKVLNERRRSNTINTFGIQQGDRIGYK